jgi:secernin
MVLSGLLHLIKTERIKAEKHDMCDTMVALSHLTLDGHTLFAKNSDRDPNEAQEIVRIPHQRYESGSQVRCTYISIPQVEESYALLLSKPFWIWGAEMGANEKGVVIGNEAIFTRVPQEKKPSLIGMDFLRLALERGATAREAMDVITKLLHDYGQAGNCGFSHPFAYDNSYLIVDPQEAWVLETAGRQWAAEKVRDIRSISNAITIDKDWDLASPGLIDYAVDQGWCRNRADFSFRRCYTEPVVTYFGNAHHRQCSTMQTLAAHKEGLTSADMISILRGHFIHGQNSWNPDKAVIGTDVCMHYGFGPIRINQTTGSMVSELTAAGGLHLLTGTAAPCTSIFKPMWLDITPPDLGMHPTGKFDPHTIWWKHEQLHRSVNKDYAARINLFREERDMFENRFIARAHERMNDGVESRSSLEQECFDQAGKLTEKWIKAVRGNPIKDSTTLYYRYAWRKVNQQADFLE